MILGDGEILAMRRHVSEPENDYNSMEMTRERSTAPPIGEKKNRYPSRIYLSYDTWEPLYGPGSVDKHTTAYLLSLTHSRLMIYKARNKLGPLQSKDQFLLIAGHDYFQLDRFIERFEC